MRNIYEKAIETMPKEFIDNHYSDLYLKVTEQSKKLVEQYDFKSNVTMFSSQTEPFGLWFDIPFAYVPYWESVCNDN